MPPAKRARRDRASDSFTLAGSAGATCALPLEHAKKSPACAAALARGEKTLRLELALETLERLRALPPGNEDIVDATLGRLRLERQVAEALAGIGMGPGMGEP